MFNHFYRIKLPEYLGFSDKGFLPIISGFFAILLGVLLAFIGPLIGRKIQIFQNGQHIKIRVLPLVYMDLLSALSFPLVCIMFRMYLSDAGVRIHELCWTNFHGDIPP